MTNETYLQVSYFAAIIFGLAVATVVFVVLRKPHRQATSPNGVKKLSTLVRRVLPSWLILAVLLAFISVSYIDCNHSTYNEVVADRGHLINKTQEQVSNMTIWLAIALFTNCLAFVLFLWTVARTGQDKNLRGRPAD